MPPAGPPPTRWRIWLFFAGLAAIGCVVIWALTGLPEFSGNRDRQIHLVYYAVWLGVLIPPLFLAPTYRLLTMLRDAAAWAGIIAVLVVGYSFRAEFSGLWARIKGELVPSAGMAAGERAIAFRAASDGHFHVEAQAQGVALRLMVDTGASDVVLSPADARRLGFDASRLSFSRVYRTANGEVLGAPVTLDELRVGPIRVTQVRASVSDGGLDQSLLGMSFLGRIGGYEVANGTLTLRQ